jgi:hypothetical protein
MMMMIMDTPITTRTCRGCEALIQRRTSSQPGSKNNNRAVSKDVTSPEESSASRVIWMCQDERCPNYVGLNRNRTKDAGGGGGGGGREHFTNGRDSVDASGIGPFRINPQRVLFQDNKESPTVDLRSDGKDLHNRSSSMEVERVWISGKRRDICFLRCRNRQVNLYFMF